MPNLRAAIEHAGTALLSVGTGLPAGDLVNLTRALFGQHGPASVKSLARTVERDLTGWIETEYGGARAIAPSLATLDDLLAHQALGLHAVVERHSMNEATVAAEIMTDGERYLRGLSQADRSLVEQLIERIYRRYLAQPELLHDLSDVALRYLLTQQALDREEFDRRLRALEGLAIPKPPPFSIPQPVTDFKGYEAELARVEAALAEGSASISAVQGIGGVGKTELAREVARRMRADFPDGQILIDMLGTTQPRDARDAMTDVLKALGQKEIQPESLVADYHGMLDGRRILVLLDNLGIVEQVESLIPRSPAALLVTSRDELVLPGVAPIVLEKLARPAAVALLRELVKDLGDADADALAELCCDLPLALRVAGSDPLVRRGSVATYLDALRARRLEHLSKSAKRARRGDRDPMVVLGYSYDRLAETDPDLARAFTLLGVFPADFDIAGAAAVLDLSPDEAEEALALLAGRSLLQEPLPGRWRLHDLLRELAEARAEAGELAEAKTRHQGHYLEALSWCAAEYLDRKRDVNKAISIVEADQPSMVAAIQRAIDADDLAYAAPGLARLGTFATALGRREDALSATEEAVGHYRRLARDRPDAFNPDLAMSLNNLGIRLDALGRREDALGATEEAVDLYRRLAEARPYAFDPYLAASVDNLGNRLAALGRREDALGATEEAVAIRRRLARDRPDAFNPDLAASLNNLGAMLDALGRREDALGATEEAVAIRRRLARDRPDAFNPDLAMSLNNLGGMLTALGRREEALQATEEAVAIRRRLAQDRPEAFGPDLSTALFNLSIDYEDHDRLDDALATNVEAIESLRPTFLRLPQAVAHWMGPMCQAYIERCEKLGIEPDAALLGPIVEVFERVEAESGDG